MIMPDHIPSLMAMHEVWEIVEAAVEMYLFAEK